MRWNIPRVSLFVLALYGIWGQNTPIQRFDVASIKLNKSAVRGGSMDFSQGGEGFTMTNMPLGALIVTAYNINVRQLSGPAELLSEKYDVAARAEHPVGPNAMLEMLQALLVDRFKLQLRRTNRDVPVYALSIAKNGVKLQQKDTSECEQMAPRKPSHAGGTERGRGHLIFRNESMPDLAWALSRTVAVGDRVVVDRTLLDGCYDFELMYGQDGPPGGVDTPTQPEGPSIFSALQEQLGLKLEPQKATVEFLVIGHLERPSEN